MSRHVVLLRRDPSLGLALRALLHGTGRVTELPTIEAWSALPGEDIDAVVIDLPVSRRTQAINLVRSRFNGRLVLVLEPNDNPAAIPTDHACSVVQRPFEIVELWNLVTTDPTPTGATPGQGGPTAPERPSAPAPQDRDAAPAPQGRPVAPPSRDRPAASTSRDQARPSAAEASTWRWRGRRYGPAPAIPREPPGSERGTDGATTTPKAEPGPQESPSPRDRPFTVPAGQPEEDPAARPRFERGPRGELPRRSANPPEPGGAGAGAANGRRRGPQPEPASGLQAGAESADASPPASTPAPPRPAPETPGPARPPSPAASQPAPPAHAATGPAPTRPGPTPAASSAGASDPGRPSMFRRLADRLGGRRPEPAAPEAPSDTRSASIPAFEPASTPSEGAPAPSSELPDWPTEPIESRPPRDEARSHPAPSRPGPAPPLEAKPSPPEAKPERSAEARPAPAAETKPAPPPPAPAARPVPAPRASSRPAPEVKETPAPEVPATPPKADRAPPAQAGSASSPARTRPAAKPPAGPDAPPDPARPSERRRRRPSRPAAPAERSSSPAEPAVGRTDPAPAQADPPAPADPTPAQAEPLSVQPSPTAVQAGTAAAVAPGEQGAAPAAKVPEPQQRQGRALRGGGPRPAPAPPSPPRPTPPGKTPAGGGRAGEGDGPRRQQPAARSEAAAPGAPAGRTPEAAETKARSGPLGVPPDAPEALLAAEQADEASGRTMGTPVRPPETTPPGTGGVATPSQDDPDRRNRGGRRARNLLRFTAPRRPEATEREVAPDAATPLADFDRLTQSIESVTEALGGQPLEFYERDLPQIAAAETARRVRADVVVLLLDNGEGTMEVSGGVGLTPAERRLNVEYSRDVMRELFRAGVGLVEDTDRVRGALAGIPGSRAETLVMVPLVHERLGFGVLMAGRNRSQTGLPTEVFSDAEVEVLMGFADAAAASLRTAVLLRHLKGQLRALEEEG